MTQQFSLLKEFEEPKPSIPGLIYLPNYISQDDEQFLVSQIDKQSWLQDLKRRVQHYGYKYDYKARNIDHKSFLGPIPEFLIPICQKLVEDKIFSTLPEQIIVNEYQPGQGISAHIDCTPCFKDIIVSLSLNSYCIMELSNPETSDKQSISLENRSLIVLTEDARYKWMHAIPGRKSDIIDGFKRARERRISLTFRNVILNA